MRHQRKGTPSLTLARLPPSSCASLSSLPLAASAAMKARSRSAFLQPLEILLAIAQSSTSCEKGLRESVPSQLPEIEA